MIKIKIIELMTTIYSIVSRSIQFLTRVESGQIIRHVLRSNRCTIHKNVPIFISKDDRVVHSRGISKSHIDLYFLWLSRQKIVQVLPSVWPFKRLLVQYFSEQILLILTQI